MHQMRLGGREKLLSLIHIFSLDIVSRLENGYHEMDMVMQSVSLYDTLTLSLQEGSGQIRMTCSLENKKPLCSG